MRHAKGHVQKERFFATAFDESNRMLRIPTRQILLLVRVSSSSTTFVPSISGSAGSPYVSDDAATYRSSRQAKVLIKAVMRRQTHSAIPKMPFSKIGLVDRVASALQQSSAPQDSSKL